MKGKKHKISDEHRQKIAELNKAKVNNPEYLQKLSQARKGRKKIYRDLENGTVEIKFVWEKDLDLYSGWYVKYFNRETKSYQKEYLSLSQISKEE